MKKSVTIIISHYESLPFLRTCLRQIEKYKNSDIEHKVLVLDQSESVIYHELVGLLRESDVRHHVCMKPLYSGYGIDYAMRYHNINTDYVCQLHADAFPISDKWLSMPIALMEEYNLTFSGILQFICEKPEPIYPFKNPFFAMAQSFHIGETKAYKEMSLEGGFTRFHNRPQSELNWRNNDWADWAKGDYHARGSDDDVPAFYWEDTYREHNKIGLGMTAKMGIQGEESGYGSITEDIVFHFGFCRESIGVMPQMGAKYAQWMRRINENYSDELIAEMLVEARKQPFDPLMNRMLWDGKLKTASMSTDEIDKRIKKLKNGLD